MTPPLLLCSLGIATASVLAALRQQRRAREAAERFAAAALETLLNAVDANDPVTGAHVRRVAAVSLVLADALGLPDDERRTVERVALFHDIGKIDAALFDIVHEAARLTPAERRAVATHPARGAAVLAPLSGFYPELAAGVLAHHERWDGQGYPKKLRGRAIPLAARIVALADTFDAVTHTRRYRRGASVARGTAVIAEGRGTQFDPELVDLFLLPPVHECAARQCAGLAKPQRAGRRERRGGAEEIHVPDVAFRWRATPRSVTALP